jgi:hypothetical protein
MFVVSELIDLLAGEWDFAFFRASTPCGGPTATAKLASVRPSRGFDMTLRIGIWTAFA